MKCNSKARIQVLYCN